MKPGLCLLILLAAALAAPAQQKRSLLDSDPDVVYLDEHVDKPIELMVIKAAPIYSDKEGKRRLGTVQIDQKVILQAMDARAYRVSAKTSGNKVVGWVAPWAFASKDPDFVKNLRKLYDRQLEVGKLIAEHRPAIGMTIDEVSKALGSPSKTKARQTEKGTSGYWEFVDFEDISHYLYDRDPVSGQVYKRFSHITREETGKTKVEFEDDIVTAIEETENRNGIGGVKIVVPPVVFRW